MLQVDFLECRKWNCALLLGFSLARFLEVQAIVRAALTRVEMSRTLNIFSSAHAEDRLKHQDARVALLQTPAFIPVKRNRYHTGCC